MSTRASLYPILTCVAAHCLVGSTAQAYHEIDVYVNVMSSDAEQGGSAW